jgi:hypothetical protein
MLIKYHDLEAYYLQRRLELLHLLDQFANEAFENEGYEVDDNNPKIEILRKEYSDVIDPENVCLTLKQIYPDHLFGIESKRAK